MRAGERGEHQVARIGMALVHLHLRALLKHPADVADMGKIELRVDALRIQIHGDDHDVDVAGALAVAEQRAFHALGARHHAELRRGGRRAAVVVRMQADDHAVAVREMAAEILDLVGIAVRRGHFHRVRQVQNQLVFRRRLQHFHHLFADEDGIVDLRAGKALRRIFVADIRAALRDFLVRQLFDQLRAFDGDVDDALHVGLEHDLALQGRSGVVEMHDDVFRAADGLKRLADQVLARLHQHLNGHVVRDEVLFDQRAENFILRFRRGRETRPRFP